MTGSVGAIVGVTNMVGVKGLGLRLRLRLGLGLVLGLGLRLGLRLGTTGIRLGLGPRLIQQPQVKNKK